MASHIGEGAYPSSPSTPLRQGMHLVIRNTLHYSISSEEYDALHRLVKTRAPRSAQKIVPAPERYRQLLRSKDDYNSATIRAALRIFALSQIGLQSWEMIKRKLLNGGGVRRLV